jgi:hypothetical protein
MEAMWRGIIQDMLEHMSPEATANSLRKRYPNHPHLLQMVQEMSPTRSDTTTTILGFCKKAQMGAGFGYGNEGQTNFSVPNSEGEVGSGNPVDNTSSNTPSSSYTDRLLSRIKVRREEEEEQKRRKKRKELLKELDAQTEPGSLLKKKKTAPTSTTPAPTPDPSVAKEWENVETEMEDTTKQTQTTTQESNKFKKKTEETTEKLEDQGDQMKDTADDAEDLADASEKASESAEKLRKSLESLVS